MMLGLKGYAKSLARVNESKARILSYTFSTDNRCYIHTSVEVTVGSYKLFNSIMIRFPVLHLIEI